MEEIEIYEIVKIFHMVAVISWMAGLLYLPRIFVYHCQVENGSQTDKIFQVMERKLMRLIMLPSMVMVFLLGGYMVHAIGFDFVWLHIKLTLVLVMAGFHGFLSRCRKNFAAGENKRSEKFYRLINEVPIVLAIFIIALVELKPF
jgi:putative membrane protein